jgi:hypothetical protein
MQHSINDIGERYSEISLKRFDKNLFIKQDFIRFAQASREKYHLIDNGDDLLVSSFYSNDLINSYKEYIKYLKEKYNFSDEGINEIKIVVNRK